MKLRLVLQTKTRKDKNVILKFPISPSKHIGFINFINLALKQDLPIELSFEKLSKTGEREESKIVGQFKLQGKADSQLYALEEEIQDAERKRKKIQQKRKHS
ncbi:MAG: hypothetical protein ACFE9S_11845 [Candidatus Hermodarchaeota archaeon]